MDSRPTAPSRLWFVSAAFSARMEVPFFRPFDAVAPGAAYCLVMGPSLTNPAWLAECRAWFDAAFGGERAPAGDAGAYLVQLCGLDPASPV